MQRGEYDCPQPFSVISSSSEEQFARDESNRFEFRFPQSWRAPNANPFALEAERQVLDWLAALGCSETELKRAAQFDVAGYVGMPFPSALPNKTVRIAKFLSLWLLFDDVHVETLNDRRWRIDASHVLTRSPPDRMTLFDKGWWQLMLEFAAKRTPRWIERLCGAMTTWNAAAEDEAMAMKEYRASGVLPPVDRQLALRIATNGMYPILSLIEDAYDEELPEEFHADPRAVRLKALANESVALGNDVLSFGKDLSEGQLNPVTTLMYQRSLSVEDALEHLVQRHNAAIEEYDRLAEDVVRTAVQSSDPIARWLQEVRFVIVGLMVWQVRSPRYTAYKVVSRNMVIEPRFRFL